MLNFRVRGAWGFVVAPIVVLCLLLSSREAQPPRTTLEFAIAIGIGLFLGLIMWTIDAIRYRR